MSFKTSIVFFCGTQCNCLSIPANRFHLLKVGAKLQTPKKAPKGIIKVVYTTSV